LEVNGSPDGVGGIPAGNQEIHGHATTGEPDLRVGIVACLQTHDAAEQFGVKSVVFTAQKPGG